MLVDESNQTPLDAATVMLIRDRSSIEVFLLERHLESDFVGGAWVFPGGKVDALDEAVPHKRLSGQPPGALVDAIGDHLARTLTIAAIRETFEESGVLLGQTATGPITGDHLRTPSYLNARQLLAARGSKWDWSGWLLDEGISLDLSLLEWWSWWVTPLGVHRRFDTKFFVAALPSDQAPEHDDIETTNSRWVTPQQALDATASGHASIILPTRKNLEQLSGYGTASAALAAARTPAFGRPRIEPTIQIEDDGQISIVHSSFDAPEQV